MSKAKSPPQLRGIDPKALVRVAETIKVLGHPERLKILEVLERGEATVSEIQDVLNLQQATVSQHLAKLRSHGVVTPERDGVNVYYRIAEPKVRYILECIRKCDL